MANVELGPDVTTLVVRTSQDLHPDAFIQMVQRNCGEVWAGAEFPFDFLYLPCPRVAIINFVSPELCNWVFQILTQRIRSKTSCVVKIQQAMYQGLATNLAVFYAKAGRRGLERRTVPKVILQGQELPLRLALDQFVTAQMVRHFRSTFRTAADIGRPSRTPQHPSSSGSSRSRGDVPWMQTGGNQHSANESPVSRIALPCPQPSRQYWSGQDLAVPRPTLVAPGVWSSETGAWQALHAPQALSPWPPSGQIFEL
ncbi:unnamed protein product [Effrenium voratum]|nr:unnamed protein product [Effrenium voratum]